MLVGGKSGTAAAGVTGAIRQAAQLTGTSFQYLLATAKIESNFNPNAAARTSSAGGLFQFIDQTWLSTLKEAGGGLGYAQYADAIQRTPSGSYAVSDPLMRSRIMKLRHDPTANAVMAGAFTKSNAAQLADRLGRQPSEGELYMAHFLGANGAARLIGSAAAQPGASASATFPNAARANRSIFYDHNGRQRSLAQVANVLIGKYKIARATAASPAQVAAAAVQPAADAKVPTFLSYVPAPETGTRATPTVAEIRGALPQTARAARAERPLTPPAPRQAAIGPAVRELWGRQLAQSIVSPADGTEQSGPLDLFGQGRRDVRSLFTGG